jgi:acetyl esterase/lipase
MRKTPIPQLAGDVHELRKVLSERKKALSAAHSTGTNGVEEEDITVPARDGHPIPIRIYKPTSPPAGGSPLVIFLHGGGFALGGLENEELNCRLFAQELGCTCVNIDYRLAPEHPFPTPLLDSWDATKWVCFLPTILDTTHKTRLDS